MMLSRFVADVANSGGLDNTIDTLGRISSFDATVSLAAGRMLVQRYRLARPVARGGMAEVWEAHDAVLDRAVAVKLMHPHLATDPSFLERFRREAIAAARLSHPNVVSTFDAGADTTASEDGAESALPFIVMELVRGPTLKQVMRDHEMSVAEAVHVARSVADALQHAHAEGLIHRDVKPGNILICNPKGVLKGPVKVADFGIARLGADLDTDGEELTQVGSVVGTAKYLSPEQVEGNKPDARSDIYALGVVLYEMLCGGPPFKGENELATALQHVNVEPTHPRHLRAGIPPRLEAIVLRALAKSPDQRFQSAGDMRDALATIDIESDDAVPMLDRDPTPPSGVRLRAAKRRRNPAPLLAFLAAAAVVVFFAVLLWKFNPFVGDRTESGAPVTELQATRVVAFDPEGDGKENDDQTGALVDGDSSTSWSTDRYDSRPFANLKDGVGVIVEIPRAEIDSIEIVSESVDWSGHVYVSAQPHDELQGWGEPVATIGERAKTVALDGAKGGAILLWFTDPGEARKLEVHEVIIRGRATS